LPHQCSGSRDCMLGTLLKTQSLSKDIALSW
jgi:hypothetical protein